MFKPKKSLGQNFLINDKILPTIIQAAEIKKDDTIIEIGPGLGILTEALLDAGARVFAIEKDFNLSTKLQKIYKNTKNIKVINQDVLWFDTSGFKNYKVVSNLPFNIASPVIRKFLENPNPPELMVVMVQKEVAEKILAEPGDSERGILTLAVEFYAKAEIIAEVSKTNFRPIPKVDATIIKIKPYSNHRPHTRYGGKLVDSELFFKIVKAGFAAKRRQIHNSLAATLRLDKNTVLDVLRKSHIDSNLRAEDLTLEQWMKLAKNFNLTSNPPTRWV